jgi:hypothetical protein
MEINITTVRSNCTKINASISFKDDSGNVTPNGAVYLDEFLAKYRISSTGLSGNFEKHFIEEEKVWLKHIDLYSIEISSYRQWFADKKRTIIAKQNSKGFFCYNSFFFSFS